ncbi:UNVERIFIED_CONTAM: hypothetical protein Slati_0977000 [Sesamum latifolium]|uniref:DUF659 domain-containing protein n=1 Tax=Sesamum latifolium TaxID=2727402 RepID=A0AAW2XR87_9LAMI
MVSPIIFNIIADTIILSLVFDNIADNTECYRREHRLDGGSGADVGDCPVENVADGGARGGGECERWVVEAVDGGIVGGCAGCVVPSDELKVLVDVTKFLIVEENVEACSRVPSEIRKMVRKLLDEGIKEKADSLRRKEAITNFVKEDSLYGDISNINVDSSDEDDDDIDEYRMSSLERKQLKQAMAESRYTEHVEDELQRNSSRGAGHYGGSSKGSKRGISQSYGVKSGVEMPSSGFSPHMFPSSCYPIRKSEKVVEEIGEQNIVQVVTDNESSFRAAGEMLMQKRKHLFWSPCAAHCIDLMLEDIGKMKSVKATIDEAKRITSFIYNSDKIVNLMKIYTKDRELLRPGISRFATEYIALKSLIRHQMELRQLCTCDERRTFNNTTKWRNEAIWVSEIVLTERV